MKRPSATPMTRRAVVVLGAAMGLSSLVPLRAPARLGSSSSSSALMLVVADARYNASEIFAARFARHGATRFSLAPDAGGLWFDALEPRLGARATCVAGLTLESDFFILRRLATASGASVLYVGWHDFRGGDRVPHRLRGGAELGSLARVFAAKGGPWPARLAEALATAPLRLPQASWQERRIACDDKQACGPPNFLVSWVIKSEEPPG
jgi:hypothetical protein